jgi:hypothetical protein
VRASGGVQRLRHASLTAFQRDAVAAVLSVQRGQLHHGPGLDRDAMREAGMLPLPRTPDIMYNPSTATLVRVDEQAVWARSVVENSRGAILGG